MNIRMLTNEFIAIFGFWEQAQPYLALIVDVAEMSLVVGMADQHLDIP